MTFVVSRPAVGLRAPVTRRVSRAPPRDPRAAPPTPRPRRPERSGRPAGSKAGAIAIEKEGRAIILSGLPALVDQEPQGGALSVPSSIRPVGCREPRQKTREAPPRVRTYCPRWAPFSPARGSRHPERGHLTVIHSYIPNRRPLAPSCAPRARTGLPLRTPVPSTSMSSLTSSGGSQCHVSRHSLIFAPSQAPETGLARASWRSPRGAPLGERFPRGTDREGSEARAVPFVGRRAGCQSPGDRRTRRTRGVRTRRGREGRGGDVG